MNNLLLLIDYKTVLLDYLLIAINVPEEELDLTIYSVLSTVPISCNPEKMSSVVNLRPDDGSDGVKCNNVDKNSIAESTKKQETPVECNVEPNVTTVCSEDAVSITLTDISKDPNNDSKGIEDSMNSLLAQSNLALAVDVDEVKLDNNQATALINNTDNCATTANSILGSQKEIESSFLNAPNRIHEENYSLKKNLLNNSCVSKYLKQGENIQNMNANKDSQIIDVDIMKVCSKDSIKLDNQRQMKHGYNLPDSIDNLLCDHEKDITNTNQSVHPTNDKSPLICASPVKCDNLKDDRTKQFSKELGDPSLKVDEVNKKDPTSFCSTFLEEKEESDCCSVELMTGDSVVEYTATEHCLPLSLSKENLVDPVLINACPDTNDNIELGNVNPATDSNSASNLENVSSNNNSSSVIKPNLSSSSSSPHNCGTSIPAIAAANIQAGSSSLKESVFKVFRGVAKSVNSEKVNENLNENFKQVYRNVFKNVTSDKFSGQALINKFSIDGSDNLKSSSSESLKSDAMNTKSDFFSILSDGEQSTKYSAATAIKANTNNSNFSDVINQSSNVMKNVDAFMLFSKTESTNLTAGSSSLSLDTSNTNQSQDLKTCLPHYMLRTSLTDVRMDGHQATVPDGANIDSTPNRLCQSVTDINCMNIDMKNVSDKGIASTAKSTVVLHKSGQEESCHPSDLSSSDGEEVTSPTTRKPSFDQESEDLSLEVSLDRWEIIGLENEQLVDLFFKLRQNWQQTRGQKKALLVEVERLDSASSHQICQQQLQALEQQLQEVRDSAYQQMLRQKQEQQLQLEHHLNARASLTNQLEAVTKQCQEAITNKEGMVIKYATAEKNVLVAQKQRDVCERRCKEMEKDKDVLLARVKNMAAEKARLTQILDKKISEYNSMNRECERHKEEVNNRDVKIKWAQNKLKAEMDTHKATHSRLEAAEAAIKGHEAEMAVVRQEAEKTVHSALQDQNSRANVLDKEVTEQKSRLIVETSCVRQLRDELRNAKSTIATLTPQNDALQEQALALKKQVASSVSEREESENLFRSLQQQLQQAQQQSMNLQHQLEKQGQLQHQLDQTQLELSGAELTLVSLQQQKAEQESELELLRSKEAELLCFTRTLSETNSSVQSKLNQATEIELSWQSERAKLLKELTGLQQDSADHRQQLTAELTDSKKRLEAVCLELRQQTGATQKLLDRVAELEGEGALQKKRHANAVKDLTRELQKLRRRVDAEDSSCPNPVNRRPAPVATVPEAVVVNPSPTATNNQNNNFINNSNRNCDQVGSNGLELSGAPLDGSIEASASPRQGAAGHGGSTVADGRGGPAAASTLSSEGTQDTLSQGSHTSSNCSLNTVGGPAEARTALNALQPVPGSLQEVQAQNQVLVQRIIKLQRSLAKKAEKEEFYEEHVAQLVGELQKKNKIIDYFVMKEEAGIMGDNRADSVKARMMQQRGIMSSIYGSQAKDEAMTLELSLEINKKLQALFEDTLLKNITLKESLSTLGDEVARLSMQASRRH